MTQNVCVNCGDANLETECLCNVCNTKLPQEAKDRIIKAKKRRAQSELRQREKDLELMIESLMLELAELRDEMDAEHPKTDEQTQS